MRQDCVSGVLFLQFRGQNAKMTTRLTGLLLDEGGCITGTIEYCLVLSSGKQNDILLLLESLK